MKTKLSLIEKNIIKDFVSKFNKSVQKLQMCETLEDIKEIMDLIDDKVLNKNWSIRFIDFMKKIETKIIT